MSKSYLIFTIVVLSLSSFGQQLPEASVEPAPLAGSQRKLVREASMLQTAGKFDEAVKKLEAAEKENAKNDVIAFELAKAHFGRKNYPKCIEKAMEAAAYQSTRLASIYTTLGNCHDAKGDEQKGLEVYEFALTKFPNDGTLHFNQAMSLNNLRKVDEARAAAKRSAILSPGSSATQLLLASIYLQQGFRVPALLAATRFLAIEPGTPRSQFALEVIKKSMQDLTKKAISASDAAISDEGDFMLLETALASRKISETTLDGKKRPDIDRDVELFESVIELLPLDSAAGKQLFVNTFYTPYFKEMQRLKHTETLWRIIHAGNKKGDSEKWLNENQQRVNDFMNWSAAYQWPKQ